MQIIYAFIYYLGIFMVFSTVSLSIFLIPQARRWLVQLWKKYNDVLETDIVRYSQYFAFGIIFLVFVQSVITYTALNAHFSNNSIKLQKRLGGFQNIDLVPNTKNTEGYLVALKQYRQYYLAERNIMLAVSALFIIFVFQRIFYNVRKYAETQSEVAKLSSKKKDA